MLDTDASLTDTATAAIILAGGVSQRMGGPLPKPFMTLGDKELLDYSVALFESCPTVVEICIVAPAERHPALRGRWAGRSKPLTLAPPGRRRQDSVYNGFCALTSACPFVVIHDSARPLATAQTTQAVLEAAYRHGAALAAVTVKSTIKLSDDGLFVSATPPRSMLWEAQTPQALRRALLAEAFARLNASGDEVTDDAQLAELIGHKAVLVPGCYSNIKITTPEDLAIAEAMLKRQDKRP